MIKIKKIHPAAKMPTYATELAGCFDLYATNERPVLVHEGWPVTFGTGLQFEIPAGHAMFILSRSGHGFNYDTRLSNCVACIDSDYRGEVKVKMVRDTTDANETPLTVMPGDRIAQAFILPVPRVTFSFADDLSDTERGSGGFGSTGK